MNTLFQKDAQLTLAFRCVVPFLDANPVMTCLNISCNQIEDAAAAVLATNQTRTTLDVSYSQIEGAGAAALAGDQMLTTLHLSGSGIRAASASPAKVRFRRSHGMNRIRITLASLTIS